MTNTSHIIIARQVIEGLAGRLPPLPLSGRGLTADELAGLLLRIVAALAEKDSFQGRLEYEVRDQTTFNVSAAIRVGNSMGQGGMILVEEWVVDPEQTGEPGPTYTRHLNATCGVCGAIAQQLEPIPGAEGPTFIICTDCGAVTQVGAGDIDLEPPQPLEAL